MISTMGNVAAAIYIDRLIALRDLKVKAVHVQAGVKPGYVSRVISGDIKEPSAVVLHALTMAVEGSWEDVGALLPRAASPGERGRALPALRGCFGREFAQRRMQFLSTVQTSFFCRSATR